MSITTPKIYVACLAAYNNGILHGKWIDATQDPEVIREEIELMLAQSPIQPAEEYAIHDIDNFEGLNIGEYESLKKVSEIALFIEEHGELGAKYLNNYGIDYYQSAIDNFEDSYIGVYSSLEEYAEEVYSEAFSSVPDDLQCYIDYESMGRDLELGGDIYTIETDYQQIHIFSNR